MQFSIINMALKGQVCSPKFHFLVHLKHAMKTDFQPISLLVSKAPGIRSRFLHLLLYAAERAWSHAMEKKTLPDGPNARQRSYLIGRLKKAVKWASQFQELCAIKGDSRTSLEAEV